MKKTLFIFILLCTFKLSSQTTFNVAEHVSNNKTSDLVEYLGNFYFTNCIKGSSIGDAIQLVSYNKQGVFRFQVTLPAMNLYGTPFKAFITNDHKIAVYGWTYGCHVVMQTGYFFKVDTNGVILTSASFASNLGFNNNFIIGCQQTNNDFYLASPTSIVHLDPSGNLISHKNIMSPDTIVNISPIPNNNILADIKSLNNIIYDWALNFYQFYTSNNNYFKHTKFNSSYFALNQGGAIEKLDTVFQSITSSSVAQQYTVGNRITDFVVNNDTLYAVGNNNSLQSTFYLKLDTNLQMISIKTNTTQNMVPSGIRILNDYCYTLNNNKGNSPSNIWHYSFNAFKRDTIYKYDSGVGLVNLTVDSYTYFPVVLALGTGTAVKFKLKATIINSGNTVLSSFKLNCQLTDGQGNCNSSRYNRLFTGLNISPTNTQTLITDSITTLLTSGNSSGVYVNLCFFTTVPNGHTDKNIIDDSNCQLFSFPLITSIPENLKVDESLNIFPNPANDVLNIHLNSETGFSEIEILNSLGQRVLKGELNSKDKTAAIDTRNLPNGVYLLMLQRFDSAQRGNSISRRFVIAR